MVGFVIIIHVHSKSPSSQSCSWEEITKQGKHTAAQGLLPLREVSFEILDLCFEWQLCAPHPLSIWGGLLPELWPCSGPCCLYFLSPAGNPTLRSTQCLTVTNSFTTGGGLAGPNSRLVISSCPAWGYEPPIYSKSVVSILQPGEGSAGHNMQRGKIEFSIMQFNFSLQFIPKGQSWYIGEDMEWGYNTSVGLAVN